MKTNTFVQLVNVSKTYKLGHIKIEALKDLNLKINSGEFTALIGASGSGKSTLLNLIGCIDDADSGEVIVSGQNVLAMKEKEKEILRNRKIGFIFQSFNLISVLTAAENIELPLLIQTEISKSDREARVQVALKEVGLGDFKHHLPDRLSGGQRQRVAIARALITKPDLILADEPTANLDSKTAHEIIDLLLELNSKKGITFLFCTHDEKLIQRVQRVISIADGKIN